MIGSRLVRGGRAGRRRAPTGKLPAMGLLVAGPWVAGGPAVGQEDARSRAAARRVAEITASARDDEWRSLDPQHTLRMALPGGTVLIELAPELAPLHTANIRALVRGGYFDGGAVRRSQDNYVVQWATRPLADDESLPDHIATELPAEFETAGADIDVTALPDGDVYAPEVGFARGFPVGRDPATERLWIAHCYGVVGVARGNDPGSGNGTGLYAVIGHAPRHLDRNLSMVGRVVAGMEHLSTLPRGSGSLGFYESPSQWTMLESVRIEADLTPEERTPLQILRTDSDSFRELVLAARSRTDEFFVAPSDRIGLCNVRVPTRRAGSDG